MKVLVVEDVQDTRESMAMVLVGYGFTVETAASGEQALGKVADSPPDVVLLDVGLPGIGGMEVVRQLGGALPVIILTAMPPEGAELLPGVVAVLSKPAPTDLLLETIRKAGAKC